MIYWVLLVVLMLLRLVHYFDDGEDDLIDQLHPAFQVIAVDFSNRVVSMIV